MLLSSIGAPVVIFLDALDQLQRPHRLGWLPERLPAGVKLVLSALDDPAYATDSEICRGLKQRLPLEAFFEIAPLGPGDGREILTALEEQARCRLRDGQRDYILVRFEAAGASPLYLRTAFEIARSWRSLDRAGENHCVLAADTAALIAQFIADLSAVHHHEPELVTRTLGYLAAAKDGLSAKELTEVLSRDAGVMQAISAERHGAQTEKIPSSVWVRLERHLAPFLIVFCQSEIAPVAVGSDARGRRHGRRHERLLRLAAGVRHDGEPDPSEAAPHDGLGPALASTAALRLAMPRSSSLVTGGGEITMRVSTAEATSVLPSAPRRLK